MAIINEGTKKILDLAGIASHFGEDVANHMKERLEEKKDEKRGKKRKLKESVSVPVTQLFDGTLKRCLVNCKAL